MIGTVSSSPPAGTSASARAAHTARDRAAAYDTWTRDIPPQPEVEAIQQHAQGGLAHAAQRIGTRVRAHRVPHLGSVSNDGLHLGPGVSSSPALCSLSELVLIHILAGRLVIYQIFYVC